MTGLPMFIPGTAPGTDPLEPLVRAALAEGRPFPRAMAPGEVWVGETLPSPETLAAVLGGAAEPIREPSSIMMAPEAIDYELLDPWIRGLIRWLNEHGYATSDSGDGVTKIAAGDEPSQQMMLPASSQSCQRSWSPPSRPRRAPPASRRASIACGAVATSTPMTSAARPRAQGQQCDRMSIMTPIQATTTTMTSTTQTTATPADAPAADPSGAGSTARPGVWTAADDACIDALVLAVLAEARRRERAVGDRMARATNSERSQ